MEVMMKNINKKFCIQKNSPTATQLLRGLLPIILIALLFGVTGCAGNDAEDGYAPVGEVYNNYEPENFQPDDLEQENYESNANEQESYEPVVYEPTNDEPDNTVQISFPPDGIIDITDLNFDLQIQELQMNRHDFIGRTIRYEGLFMSTAWNDITLYFVARLLGSCCGVYGFEVYLNEFSIVDNETWVEVTGVLEEFYVEALGQNVLRLNVTSLVER
jgi:uncharacterized membrane protein YcgQ (UPF0703/DUF1980 family)